MDLTGKNILITGASQGLGKELAFQLDQKNANVILLARTEKLLQENVDMIKNQSGNASYVVCDIKDETQIHKAVAEIITTHKSIDILINNAGVWTDDNLELSALTKREAAIQTNLLGQIQITEALLTLLNNQSEAIIVNVISSAGVSDIPASDNRNWKTYGSSKWGFTGYTQALRDSLRDTNIKVIQFFPGGFESNLYENAGRDNPHNQPWMMQTKDVAEIVVFALTRPSDVYMEKIVVTKKM